MDGNENRVQTSEAFEVAQRTNNQRQSDEDEKEIRNQEDDVAGKSGNTSENVPKHAEQQQRENSTTQQSLLCKEENEETYQSERTQASSDQSYHTQAIYTQAITGVSIKDINTELGLERIPKEGYLDGRTESGNVQAAHETTGLSNLGDRENFSSSRKEQCTEQKYQGERTETNDAPRNYLQVAHGTAAMSNMGNRDNVSHKDKEEGTERNATKESDTDGRTETGYVPGYNTQEADENAGLSKFGDKENFSSSRKKEDTEQSYQGKRTEANNETRKYSQVTHGTSDLSKMGNRENLSQKVKEQGTERIPKEKYSDGRTETGDITQAAHETAGLSNFGVREKFSSSRNEEGTEQSYQGKRTEANNETRKYSQVTHGTSDLSKMGNRENLSQKVKEQGTERIPKEKYSDGRTETGDITQAAHETAGLSNFGVREKFSSSRNEEGTEQSYQGKRTEANNETRKYSQVTHGTSDLSKMGNRENLSQKVKEQGTERIPKEKYSDGRTETGDITQAAHETAGLSNFGVREKFSSSRNEEGTEQSYQGKRTEANNETRKYSQVTHGTSDLSKMGNRENLSQQVKEPGTERIPKEKYSDGRTETGDITQAPHETAGLSNFGVREKFSSSRNEEGTEQSYQGKRTEANNETRKYSQVTHGTSDLSKMGNRENLSQKVKEPGTERIPKEKYSDGRTETGDITQAPHETAGLSNFGVREKFSSSRNEEGTERNPKERNSDGRTESGNLSGYNAQSAHETAGLSNLRSSENVSSNRKEEGNEERYQGERTETNNAPRTYSQVAQGNTGMSYLGNRTNLSQKAKVQGTEERYQGERTKTSNAQRNYSQVAQGNTGMSNLGNMTNLSQQSKQQGTEMMQDQFIVYCPGATEVYLEFKRSRGKPVRLQLQRISADKDLWKTSSPLRNVYTGQIYTYKYKSSLWNKIAGAASSNEIELSARQVHRHIIDDYETGVLHHVEDILLLGNAKSDLGLKEMCTQIESITSDINPKEEKRLISMICDIAKFVINYGDRTQCMLAVFATGYFCWCCSIPLNKITFYTDVARIILKSMEHCSLKEFPSSCQEYIPNVFDKLVKTDSTTGNHSLDQLVTRYSFFGENEALGQLQTQSLQNQIKSVKYSDGTINSAKRLLFLIFQNSENSPYNRKDEAIGRLAGLLPYKVMFKVISDLEFDGMVSEDDCNGMFQIMHNRTQDLIANIQKQKDFTKLRVTWEDINDLVRKREDIVNLFEEAILQMTKTHTQLQDSAAVEIERLLFSGTLFKTLSLQVELLTTLSSVKNKKVNETFIRLSENVIKPDAYRVLEIECFKQWFYAIPLSSGNKRQKLLVYACERLLSLIQISELMRREDLSVLVGSILTSEMGKYNPKELVKEIETVDNVASICPTIAHGIIEHISKYICDNPSYTRNLDILRTLRNNEKQLTVNTQLQADVVCLIMKLQNERQRKHAHGEDFFNIIDCYEFWRHIFKASGKKNDLVLSHESFSVTKELLVNTLKRMKAGDVSMGFMLELQKNFQNAIVILSLIISEDDAKQTCSSIVDIFETEIQLLDTVDNILTLIWKKGIELPPTFNMLVERLIYQRKRLAIEEIKANQLIGFWDDMKELPKICRKFETNRALESDVFWNLLQEELTKMKLLGNRKQQPISDDDEVPEQSSEPMPVVSSNDELLMDSALIHSAKTDTGIESALEYISKLENVGCETYRKAFNQLKDEEGVEMVYVLKMFGNKPDLQKERKINELIIEVTLPDQIWHGLVQVFSVTDLAYTVASMKQVLQVLEIDIQDDNEFCTAVSSFDQLLEQNVDGRMFVEVKKAISTIFAIVKELSHSTKQVMSCLSGSLSLIEFLRETMDEDIKYLIDAVEDISEKHVQESTVSGLMDIKGYLQPILAGNFKGHCRLLFQTLQIQTETVKNIAVLPGKIEDCMDNFHNLKSLYKNFAHRGEQTKEIVMQIIERGTFTFCSNQQNNTLTLLASYEQNVESGISGNPSEQKNIEVVKQKDVLIDLRSRSLLLMNTEREDMESSRCSSKELGRFVGYIEECLDLLDTLSTLHSSGHVDYEDINIRLLPSELNPAYQDLTKTLKEWKEDLESEREKFYLLNFMQGSALHLLYKYFNTFSNLDEHQKSILSENVETLLMFIHPDMKTTEIQKFYHEENSKHPIKSKRNMLHCMGYALHKAWPKTQMKRNIILQEEGKPLKMTDVVQKGKLLVAQLDESSKNTVKTVLALYANTTGKLPEPNHVLFCTRETTLDELELLINRCLGETQFFLSQGLSFTCNANRNTNRVFKEEQSLFCIANVEMLPSEIQFNLLESLRQIQSKSKEFLLTVVCRGSRSHPFIDELSAFVTTVSPATDNTIRDIFHSQCPNVYTITSDLAGQGKSTFIHSKAQEMEKCLAVLHISGCLRKRTLVQNLRLLHIRTFHVLHIDIGNIDDPIELDTFLFELIILRYVSSDAISVGLVTPDVFLEITNTINDNLRDCIQTAMLFKRENLKWNDFQDFAVSKEIHSPVQVVCRYLNCIEKGTLDNIDLCISESTLKHALSGKRCRLLLKKYIKKTEEMSFPVAVSAVKVLADQLKKMSCSPFFRISRLKDMIGSKTRLQTKSTLVLSMLSSTNEFASRSVRACRDTQTSTLKAGEKQSGSEQKQAGDISALAAQSVEGMIRWEESNHLMFVFHNQNIQTISPLYRDIKQVEEHIKELFERQMRKPLEDFKSMKQTQLQDLLQKIARTDPMPLPGARLLKLAKDYALTPDNLLKMVLIMLRIKAKVPVVIMGETGCGKTSLVRYLSKICGVKFDIMNIHAGITEEAIVEKVLLCNSSATNDLQSERWLFLDEINTSESVGILSDIICHHKCLSTHLSPNLVILGACNPYKLRSSKAIASAGLTGKSKTDELSRLIYRVLPLPEMMVDYVWDFGSLSENDEKLYIERMVDGIFIDENYHNLFVDFLSVSQCFVRSKEASSYVVSLRDVYRCKRLTIWFEDVLRNKKKKPIDKYSTKWPVEIRAMVLALAHCYHSRFADKSTRGEYREKLIHILSSSFKLISEPNADYINAIILEEQRDILSRMEVPDGTARNTALMENVFVILVCIFNKIPVFVVGKPGCSKSLAMQVIRSNLRGKDSKNSFFKQLPQLYCVSFQGSESSTSDGIIKVFEKAENYRRSNSEEDVLSVVILDEIGLAEVSRFNPLKVLHNLLESDGQHGPNVAVVGISNWALDASKMNRAIHLSRTDMDKEELYETGVSISDSFMTATDGSALDEKVFLSALVKKKVSKDLTTSAIKDELKWIADCYSQYTGKLRFKNFHGLRDYYALVKYVARTVLGQTSTDQNTKVTKPYISNIVMEGLERNFGGLPDEMSSLYQIFNSRFKFSSPFKQNTLDLINENVQDTVARHLMLITSGDSALGILEKQLQNMGRTRKNIIFGSQFEDDLTDDYNYRILSRIILCMEQGIVLVLKDLDNVYGSLYDMLNQNYTMIGNKKNCRVALGAYSNPICHVADTFRCIVLMDESKLESCDPPFLNRFEKQYLRFADILHKDHLALIQQLHNWINGLRNIQKKYFEFLDIFPIYSEDLLASLVWKLETSCENTYAGFVSTDQATVLRQCQNRLLWILRPEAVVRLNKAESQSIRSESDDLKRQYFDLPIHEGLEGLFKEELESEAGFRKEGIMTIIFTNSNVHTKIHGCLGKYDFQIEKIGSFKSEKQLSARIQHFWSTDSSADILLVQCSAVDNEKHIILTKSIIERYKEEFRLTKPNLVKHAYLIIHLDRSKGTSKITSQINFVSEWKLVMMDSLERPRIPLKELCELSLLDAIERKRPLNDLLTEQLFWAFTRIKYGSFGRDIKSIQYIIEKMKTETQFMALLEEEIWTIVSDKSVLEKESQDEDEWQGCVACDVQALRNSTCFVDALEQYIIDVINIPLSKLIYNMEMHGILESYFLNDDIEEQRRKAWLLVLENGKIFSVKDIPDETGPECFACDTPDLSLKMPFSKAIYNRIEAQKDAYLEDVSLTKARFELESDEELPHDVNEQLLKKQERFLVQNIPDWDQFFYERWEDDYIHDFCNILSHAVYPSMERDQRTMYMKWIIKQKTNLDESDASDTFSLLVCLHATSWLYSSLFRAEMQLFGICEKVLENKDILTDILFSNKETQEKYVANKSRKSIFKTDNQAKEERKPCNLEALKETKTPDEGHMSTNVYIVHHICRSMLPSPSTLKAYQGIKNWQRKINTVLALAAKVSRNSKMLHSLRVCNEIASNVIIPLELMPVLLEEMGELLLSGCALDSPKVFDSVVNIFNTGLLKPNNQTSDISNCYTVLSSYLVRCYIYNVDSTILDEVFLSYHKEKLPEHIVSYLKAPLFLAFDLEIDEFNELLEIKFDRSERSTNNTYQTENVTNETCEGTTAAGEKKHENDLSQKSQDCQETIDESVDPKDAEKEDVTENLEDSFLNGVLVNQLDKVLVLQDGKGKRDTQFSLLIVDILNLMYQNSIKAQMRNEKENTPFTTVLYCHKVLTENSFSIKTVASVAYLKAFAYELQRQPLSEYESTKGFWKTMDTILSHLSESDISMSILILFLKSISCSMTICRLQKMIRNSCTDFAKHIPWDKEYENNCFEKSPLCAYVDCSSHENPIHTHLIPSKIEETSSLIVKRANENTTQLLAFFCFVTSQFYFPKSSEAITDSKRSCATFFLTAAEAQKCSWSDKCTYLCGQKDFAVSCFNISEENCSTESTQSCMVSVLMPLYMMLISNSVFQKKKSLLTQILQNLSSIDSCFLPGFIDDEDEEKNKILIPTRVSFATCICGYRIACRKTNEEKKLRCFFCQKLLNTSEKCVTYTDKREKRGVIWKFSDLKQSDFAIRNLHPVTSHILQMLIKSCLLGSLAFRYSQVEDIQEFTDMADIDSDGCILWADLVNHWQRISAMLSMNDNTTAIFMHNVLIESQTLLLDNSKLCKTVVERKQLEDEFEEKIKETIQHKSFKTKDLLRKHNSMHHMDPRSLETKIFETDDKDLLDRTTLMPMLFRVNENPSKESFLSEFHWRRDEYPFLDLVLQYEPYLKMPSHIFNIVNWHIATVSNASYVLKRFDCQEMTVSKFLYLNPAKKGTKLEKIFTQFQKSWNMHLMKLLRYHKISSKMEIISVNSKMKECLIDSKTSILYEVLQILLQIQNEFLDKTLHIATSCSSLHFLSRDENISAIPCVQISQVKEDDLINFKLDWKEKLSSESHCVLEYGQGCQVVYDFGSIEKGIAISLVAGKSYISSTDNLPKNMFTDELFVNYADLIIELKKKVPQKRLTVDLEAGMRNKIKEDPRTVRDLLTHLGILMTLLKKTGGEGNKPLVVYANEWKHILTHEFPHQLLPIPETCIHLCHIVALSDLLEEICADSIIDSLEMEYRDSLDEIINGQIMVILQKGQFSHALLRAIKIFAHRSLSSNSADCQRPLCNYLSDESFWPDGSKRQNTVTISDKTENLLSLLPNNIMVRHVYALVKKMEFEIKKQQEESLQMKKLHSSFQQAKTRQQTQQKGNTKRTKAARFRDY